MSRRTGLLIGLLVLLLLASGALFLSTQLERYEKTVDQGPSPEAKANPWLAAEHFLRGLSVTVNTVDTLAQLPDPSQSTQTLLLLDDREDMTPAQTQKLLDWAEAGGHLLFVAEQLWDEQKVAAAICCWTVCRFISTSPKTSMPRNSSWPTLSRHCPSR